MDRGLTFSILSAASFSFAHVFLRKGTVRAGESFSAVPISVFLGTVVFLLSIVFTNKWDALVSLSLQGWLLLGVAGIIQFVVGRFLFFTAIRLIGANKAAPISQTSILIAAILGVVVLRESVTIYLISGILCLSIGTTLVSIQKGGQSSRIHSKGILAAFGTAILWGTSGVLVKPAVTEMGVPHVATFVSFLVASLVSAGILFRKEQRHQLMQLKRESLVPIVIAGVFSSVATLLRYVALVYSPVSVVQPLIGTTVLSTFFLSFLINRKIEVFTLRVFIGIVVIIVGAFFLFL